MSLDPQIASWLDQMDQLVIQNIRQHGVHLERVLGDTRAERAALTYTVGLFGLRHPELLILGIHRDFAFEMLNELAGEIREGRQLVLGELVTFSELEHRVTVEQSPNPGAIVFGANRHYQRPDEASVPVFQLTWDDPEGRFPWDEGYSLPAWVQPRPGTFTA